MDASERKISLVRVYVFVGGVIGLAIIALLAFAGAIQESGLGDLALLGLFCGPFVLALLSLLLRPVERQRWVWLVCAMLTVAVGLPLIFGGVGFFLLAIAVCFAWAFATTSRRHLPSSLNLDQRGARR